MNTDLTSLKDVWYSTLGDLFKQTPITCSKGAIYEIVGHAFVIDGALEQFVQCPRRKASPIYAAAETLWYLSGAQSGDMIRRYAPQYEKFLNWNGDADGAYGYRIFEKHGNLMEVAMDLIKQKESTKQAVLPIYEYLDLAAANAKSSKDIPCTLSWQFLVRDGRLDMICTMRSNDAWLGLPYDVFANTTIQKLVAAALDLLPGRYFHRTGSMHLYEKNFKAAEEAVSQWAVPWREYTQQATPQDWSRIPMTLKYERHARMGIGFAIPDGFPALSKDLILLCASKFIPGLESDIHSPILRVALNTFQEKP